MPQRTSTPRGGEVFKTAVQSAKNLEKFGPRKIEVNRYTQ